MSLSCQKGEFDRFFNRLDRPVEESRPDRQPDRPVDPTGAGRPNRFPSLDYTTRKYYAHACLNFASGFAYLKKHAINLKKSIGKNFINVHRAIFKFL